MSCRADSRLPAIRKDPIAFVFSDERAKKLNRAGRWIYKRVIDPAVFSYAYGSVNKAPADTAVRVRLRGSLGTLKVQQSKMCGGFCRVDYRTSDRRQAVLWIPAERFGSVFANNLAVMVVMVMVGGGWFSSRWTPYRVSAPLHAYMYIYIMCSQQGVEENIWT